MKRLKLSKRNGQSHTAGQDGAQSRPRAHTKDPQASCGKEGGISVVRVPIPFTPFASQLRGEHCRGRDLQGRPLFTPERQPPSLSQATQQGGEEDEADGQTGGQDRWQDRRTGQTRKNQPPTPSV